MSTVDLNSDDDYDSVEQRDIARQFRKELQESEGFDCTVVPDEFDIGGFATVDLDKHTNTAREVTQFTIRAVNGINRRLGVRKLEFLRVLSANLKISSHFTVYVTFVARDLSSGEEIVYETQLCESVKGDLHLQFCRTKHGKEAVLIAGKSESSNQEQESGSSETPLSVRSIVANVPSHFDKSIRKMDTVFKWAIANGMPSNCAPRDAMMNPGRIFMKGYVGKANVNDKKLLKLVKQHNVVIAAVLRATRAFFKLKKEEIFEGAAENDAYIVHSLSIVGHGKSKDGRRYFEVTTCWGPDWADGGYGKVLMRKCPPGRSSSIFTHIYYPVTG